MSSSKIEVLLCRGSGQAIKDSRKVSKDQYIWKEQSDRVIKSIQSGISAVFSISLKRSLRDQMSHSSLQVARTVREVQKYFI